MADPTCIKCTSPSEHSLHIREGSPYRDPAKPKVPDKSRLRIVRLCDEHWEEIRLFMGLTKRTTIGGTT